MKALIILVVGMIAVGCRSEVEKLEEENRRMEAQLKNDKLKRLPVVGEYALMDENGKVGYERGEVAYKLVLLENGLSQKYKKGRKHLLSLQNQPWSIVDEEIHIDYSDSDNRVKKMIEIWRINADKSITFLYLIKDGERIDLPKDVDIIYKKIK